MSATTTVASNATAATAAKPAPMAVIKQNFLRVLHAVKSAAQRASRWITSLLSRGANKVPAGAAVAGASAVLITPAGQNKAAQLVGRFFRWIGRGINRATHWVIEKVTGGVMRFGRLLERRGATSFGPKVTDAGLSVYTGLSKARCWVADKVSRFTAFLGRAFTSRPAVWTGVALAGAALAVLADLAFFGMTGATGWMLSTMVGNPLSWLIAKGTTLTGQAMLVGLSIATMWTVGGLSELVSHLRGRSAKPAPAHKAEEGKGVPTRSRKEAEAEKAAAAREGEELLTEEQKAEAARLEAEIKAKAPKPAPPRNQQNRNRHNQRKAS